MYSIKYLEKIYGEIEQKDIISWVSNNKIIENEES